MNRKEIHTRPLHHDFIERFTHLGPDEKYVHSMAGLWRDETRRRKLRMGLTDPSSSPFPPEVLVSMSADPRNTDNGGWIHEEEFREMIQELIEQEAQQDKRGGAGFEDFVKPVEEEARIKTVLESVEDLFSCNLSSSLCDTSGTAALEEAVVDEMSIPRANDADSAYDSDEDTAREIALTQAALKKTDVGHDTSDGETREEDMDEMRPDGAAYAAAFDDPEDPINPPRENFAGHSDPVHSFGSFDNGMVDDAALIQSEIETFQEGNVAADQRAAKRQ
ncbi:hypothetical protein LTS18_001247, partial [Coniosporium uncinatum]